MGIVTVDAFSLLNRLVHYPLIIFEIFLVVAGKTHLLNRTLQHRLVTGNMGVVAG